MDTNHLLVTIEATHQSLDQRLSEATQRSARWRHPRDLRPRVDAFMAATSRHLAAAEEVLVPETVRRRVDGAARAEEYLEAARQLEQALTRLKARLYGELHVAHVPWPEVWADVRRCLTAHAEAELALARHLSEVLDRAEAADLAWRVYRAELRAPTRAHPYLPHTGLVGLAARRVSAVADRFWDTAQSRDVPAPVRPHPREHAHDSLLAQYLVGEPLFDADAPVVHHQRRPRGQRPPDRAPRS
jgi:hypothetical protein